MALLLRIAVFVHSYVYAIDFFKSIFSVNKTDVHVTVLLLFFLHVQISCFSNVILNPVDF